MNLKSMKYVADEAGARTPNKKPVDGCVDLIDAAHEILQVGSLFE